MLMFIKELENYSKRAWKKTFTLLGKILKNLVQQLMLI